MTKLELKDHPIWRDLTEIFTNFNAENLMREHLSLCDYQICGYWDENDHYYEIVNLPSNLEIELTSSSIGFNHKQRFLKLKFFLKAVTNKHLEHKLQNIGEVELLYNENMEFIDENWYLYDNFLQNTVISEVV
jgi:hypothetical protein